MKMGDIACEDIATGNDNPRKDPCNGSGYHGNDCDDIAVRVDTHGDRDTRCGYGQCLPDCLQKSANTKALLAVICWFVFVQSYTVNGINNVNTATMERRFDLRSEQVAWITSAYDLAGGFLAVILGYLGNTLYKGRILTYTAVIMGVGSLVMFLPHFLVGPYKLGQAESAFCVANGTSLCESSEDQSSLASYLYVFITGQVLHSVGGTAVYTLAVPYLDENVGALNTPLYVGIFQAFSALGPAVGFIGGGALLNIYVDIDKVDMDTITITPEDPRWVGAWWIGFMISCFGGFSIAIFMGCFPRELPEARRLRLEREANVKSAKAKQDQAEDNASFRDKQNEMAEESRLKQMGRSLKTFFTTPSFIFMTLGGIVESGAVIGFATFLPKVIQFQFAQSPSQAAFLAGVLTVPGAAGGQLLGGAIPKWLKLKPRGLLLQTFVCSLAGVALSFAFLMRCDMAQIAGINVPYYNHSDIFAASGMSHPCNNDCGCTTESYNPLCYNNIEYFSPCHAGCQREIETDGHVYYANCSCIPDVTQEAPPGEWASGWGESGTCARDCSLLIPYLVLFFLLMLVTFMSNTAGQSGTIRCVSYKDRAFGFGLQCTLVRFLGNVPFPLILGKIFDGACWMWQEKCGVQGSCWIYDNDSLSVGICLACLIVKVISSICFGLAALFFKPMDDDLSYSVTVDGNAISRSNSVDAKGGNCDHGANNADNGANDADNGANDADNGANDADDNGIEKGASRLSPGLISAGMLTVSYNGGVVETTSEREKDAIVQTML